jgi:hypothetical protein
MRVLFIDAEFRKQFNGRFYAGEPMKKEVSLWGVVDMPEALSYNIHCSDIMVPFGPIFRETAQSK